MCHDYFLVICKKRSTDKETVYWRDDYAGYTSDIAKAGRYRGADLEACGGYAHDWYAEKHHQECTWRRKNPHVLGVDKCPEE